ncbi:PKD domain-containing protein [Myceligenerans salitolerans]|uniref:PKD domain-containing protein n=1 Tax=Myceligenerans salitolerans TaxID=1230528 RepID=A0ABS3I929_9MICO|nr:PKD domain-containing protein [Myceligenerans salitolerans]MBO0609455.1 PKD domain-containing protein [Myceligenerans salitolerans]
MLPAFRAECEHDGQRLAHSGVECHGGQQAQGALFEQRRSGDAWTAPRIVEEESCVDDVRQSHDEVQTERRRQQVDIPAAAARAFQNMTIEPSALAVQPPDGWTLVNLDTIAYAENQSQVLDTDLFGIPVSIRAVPETYTWSWGDGTSSTGADPGAPYPNHTIAHAYTAPGTAVITLRTTWRGQFRLSSDAAWRDVPGQAITTSQSPPIEIREARTRLVEDLSY